MSYTLREAADAAGRSRSTIHRAIRSGRLSAQRKDGGFYAIDPAELARVFPRDAHDTSQRDAAEHPRNTSDGADTLRVRVEMLEQQLRREQETVDDLRSRLDRAEERAFALAAPAVQQQSRDGSAWNRLRRFLGGA